MSTYKEIEYYPVKLRMDKRDFFLIWYSSENEDRIISSDDELEIFNSLDELINFSKSQLLRLNLEEEISFYDLDKSTDNDIEEVLNLWNLFTDIAISVNISFLGDIHGQIRNDVYNKLCDDVIWKKEIAFFTDKEQEFIKEALIEGKEIIRQEIKKTK